MDRYVSKVDIFTILTTWLKNLKSPRSTFTQLNSIFSEYYIVEIVLCDWRLHRTFICVQVAYISFIQYLLTGGEI